MRAETEWWTQNDHKLVELENNERGITELYARQVNGIWEYAVVFWQYHHASLECLFREGVVIKEPETGF